MVCVRYSGAGAVARPWCGYPHFLLTSKVTLFVSNLAPMNRIWFVAALVLFLQPAHSDEAISGYWQSKSGLAHFNAHRIERGFSFTYVTDGAYRCEVPGVAEPAEKPNVFVFKNQPQYWLHANGYEGYGFPETNGDCSLTFAFDSSQVTVTDSGNCKSFCGLNGSLGAQLARMHGWECFNAGDNYRVRDCVSTSYSESQASLDAAVKSLRGQIKRDTKLLDDAQAKWSAFVRSECEVRAIGAEAYSDPETTKALFLEACAADLNAERLLHLQQIPLGCDSCLQ
jgi:uncharacterized protein YecT (DUF1311 family)